MLKSKKAVSSERAARRILDQAVSRASIEPLEMRRLLSYTVTSLADDGSSGTLRWAITQANTAGGDQTINFSSSLTSGGPVSIDLSNTLPTLDDTSGTLTIDGPGASLLTINGGGAHRLFVTHSSSIAVIEGLTLTDGYSSVGGAVSNAGTLTITECDVDSNIASINGGAITNSHFLTITDSTISGNSAPLGEGGAIVNSDFAEIDNSTISGNTTFSYGGGLYNSGTITINGSTLTDNSANGGAAIGNGGELFITNSTLSGNTADATGGGIYSWGSLTVTDSTITGNTAATGGGADSYYGGDTIDGTIVAGNTGGDLSSGFTGSYNLIGDGSGGLSASSHNLLGSAASPIDPMLGALSFNGGDTQTMQLLPGSPAIAAGSSFSETVDQRGVARSGVYDIGAYQTLEVNTLDDDPVGSGLLSFRDAISQANSLGGNQTITFDPALTSSGPTTIDLSDGALEIDDPTGTVSIAGPGAALLTIDGQNESTDIIIDSTTTGDISGLTIANGYNATYGGGIYNQGTLNLCNAVITGNSAFDGGGGIYNTPSAEMTISDSTITDNATQYLGAGLFNAGEMTITNSTLSDNTCVNGDGGAIFNGNSSATLTISDSTIVDNTSDAGLGGGVSNLAGTFTATNCTLTGNSAVFGGAISNEFSTMTVIDSTIADNTASNPTGGGGIHTIYSTTTLEGSIVAQNTHQDITGTINTGTYDLVGDGTGGLSSSGSSHNILGTTGSPTNPELGSLADNGGSTETMALLSGSPAIGAGSAFDLNIDQRGMGRPGASNAYDIGAYQTPLAAPTNLQAVTVLSSGLGNILSWSAIPGATIDGYAVQRSTDDTTWTQIGNPTTTTFTDTTAVPGTTYYYRVAAGHLNDGSILPASLWATSDALTTSSFLILMSQPYSAAPSSYGDGMLKIDVPNGGAYFVDGNTADGLDATSIASVAAAAVANDNGYLALDIEVSDPNWVPFTETTDGDGNVTGVSLDTTGVANLETLIADLRADQPSIKIGFYGWPGDIQANDYDWHEPYYQQDWTLTDDEVSLLSGLMSHCDFVAPALYTYQSQPDEWAAGAEKLLELSQSYGKPVYPFVDQQWVSPTDVLPAATTYADSGDTPMVSANYWQMELAVVGRYANGVIVWNGDTSPWSTDVDNGTNQQSWWSTLQNFATETSASLPSITASMNGGTLSWTAPSSGQVDGYEIYRKINSGSWEYIADVPADYASYDDPQYTLDDVSGSDNTYYYEVEAVNGLSASSLADTSSDGSTVNANTQLPAVSNSSPDDPAQSFGVQDQLPYIWQWDNGETSEYPDVNFGSGSTQFEMMASVDAGQDNYVYVYVDSVSSSNLVATVELTSTGANSGYGILRFAQFSTDLTSEVTGEHNVFFKFGTAVTYNAEDIAWFGFDQAAPMPIDVTATPTSTNVGISWQSNCDESGETFIIQRTLTPQFDNTWSTIGTSSTSSYTDTPAIGGLYYYRVIAENDFGNSVPTVAVQAAFSYAEPFTTGYFGEASTAPTVIGGQGGTYFITAAAYGSLDNSNSDYVDQYPFAYQTEDTDGSIQATVDSVSGFSTYASVGLMVRASNDTSAPFVSMEWLAGGPVYTGYRNTESGSTGGYANWSAGLTLPVTLKITWTSSGVISTYYLVGSTWTYLYTTTIDVSSGLLVGLSENNNSSAADMTAQFSNVFIQLPDLPTAPTSLTATPSGTSAINLSWQDNATTDIDHYRVYRSTNGVDYTMVEELGDTATSWEDTDVSSGNTYYYYVVSEGESVESPQSETAKVVLS